MAVPDALFQNVFLILSQFMASSTLTSPAGFLAKAVIPSFLFGERDPFVFFFLVVT
jgi:hypothetical protein